MIDRAKLKIKINEKIMKELSITVSNLLIVCWINAHDFGSNCKVTIDNLFINANNLDWGTCFLLLKNIISKQSRSKMVLSTEPAITKKKRKEF